MGSIAAVLRRDGAPAGAESARRLGEALRRRGPGALASREDGPAALIALAGPAASGPALAADDGAGLVLAFDGRLDGGDGREGDAARALRLLAEHGPVEGAARLEGEFAFLLWDGRRRVLSAGRDVLGVRPLLLHDDGRRVAFATAAAALVDGAAVPLFPDEGVAAEVLAGGPWSREATIVRGVRRVLPGTVIEFGPGGIEERTFGALAPRRDLPADPDEAAAHLRDALAAAVARRLRGPGPAALALSGGLDSGAVAALSGGGLRAFTVSFPGLPLDETALARAAAAAAGISIEVVPASTPGPDRFVAEAARSRDLPDAPPAAALDGMAERIRAGGFAAVLDGEGGDEVLAPHGPRSRIPRPLRAAFRRLRPAAAPPWIDARFARRVDLADRRRPGAGDPASDLVGAYALWCRESLDRWGVRCGAEALHPFLDREVAGIALGLAPALRDSKDALRRALAGRLPDEVRLRRDKADFTPLAAAAVAGASFPLLSDAGWIDPAALAAAPLGARVAALGLEGFLAAARGGVAAGTNVG